MVLAKPTAVAKPVAAASLLPRGAPAAVAPPLEAITCLLTTVHPERALSLALIKHLAEELPEFRFTLVPRPGIDLVWVCGYTRGSAQLIREQRRLHPHASLLVTSKQAEELWAEEALEAGADDALAWPVGLARLARILRRRQLRRPA